MISTGKECHVAGKNNRHVKCGNKVVSHVSLARGLPVATREMKEIMCFVRRTKADSAGDILSWLEQ